MARNSSRNELLAAAISVALGLALRLFHLVSIRELPVFRILYLDPLAYDQWGREIASGNWIGDRVFFQDPLYPYFLGVIYSMVGHRTLVVAALQVLLGASVPMILFLSARRWIGKPAALAAAFLSAVYLPSVFYEGMVLKTSVGMFLVALLLWALSASVGTAQERRWLLVGLVAGFACLARGNLVLFPPCLALWLVLDRSATGAPSRDRRRWLALGCLLLGAGLVLGPTAIRNRIVGGHWVLTTANGGQNFYIGNNPDNRTGEYGVLPFVDPNPIHEENDFAREAARRTGREMTPPEISRFWFREAMTWIAGNPGGWARLTWLKFRAYWGAYEIPDNLDLHFYRERAPALRIPFPGFGLLAPLGLVGALFAWRRGGWPRLLVLFAGLYSCSVILFFVFSRFRMAMMPALFVLAGIGITELWNRVRNRKRWSAILGPAALMIAAFLFVNLPVRGVEDSWAVRLATALHLPVRVEHTGVAHMNLGLAYARKAGEEPDEDAWLERAEAELREAARLENRFAKPHAELGKVLARLGRNREAIESFRTAVRLEPGDWRNHHTLGLLHRRVRDLPSAERSFRKAIERHPRPLDSLIRLGETQLELGRMDEAEETFRRALQIDPGSRKARRGLAAAM